LVRTGGWGEGGGLAELGEGAWGGRWVGCRWACDAGTTAGSSSAAAPPRCAKHSPPCACRPPLSLPPPPPHLLPPSPPVHACNAPSSLSAGPPPSSPPPPPLRSGTAPSSLKMRLRTRSAWVECALAPLGAPVRFLDRRGSQIRASSRTSCGPGSRVSSDDSDSTCDASRCGAPDVQCGYGINWGEISGADMEGISGADTKTKDVESEVLI
jgi:hypothetical protein